MAGWHSVLGYHAPPTIIPHYEVPIDKPPFEYGYEQARAFACGHTEEDTFVPDKTYQRTPLRSERTILAGDFKRDPRTAQGRGRTTEAH